MAVKWKDAVRNAIVRVCKLQGSRQFSAYDLRAHLDSMVRETGSRGRTPMDTVFRELQELRDLDELIFLDYEGQYEVSGSLALRLRQGSSG